jgi:predicted alpha/beta-fold hydrolase
VPLVASAYRAPAWLPGGHLQTVYPYYLRRRRVSYRRERWTTPDEDFVDVDWAHGGAEGGPLVLLLHGLEGDSDSQYARGLMAAAVDRGWRGAVAHWRGCSGEPNRRPRAYHSGDHAEAGWIIRRFADAAGEAALFVVGVSLGGSALLNWLGREGRQGTRTVRAAAAVSAPIDLLAAGRSIDQGLNRAYARHFLSTLVPKALDLADRHPGLLDRERVRRARTMFEFDDAVTAPLHGFGGAIDYWTRGSSKPWLTEIAVPTLALNARNDPFIPGASLPGPDEASAAVRLEQPAEGGHVGFLTGPFPGRLTWLPRRLLAFFDEVAPDLR